MAGEGPLGLAQPFPSVPWPTVRRRSVPTPDYRAIEPRPGRRCPVRVRSTEGFEHQQRQRRQRQRSTTQRMLQPLPTSASASSFEATTLLHRPNSEDSKPSIETRTHERAKILIRRVSRAGAAAAGSARLHLEPLRRCRLQLLSLDESMSVPVLLLVTASIARIMTRGRSPCAAVHDDAHAPRTFITPAHRPTARCRRRATTECHDRYPPPV